MLASGLAAFSSFHPAGIARAGGSLPSGAPSASAAVAPSAPVFHGNLVVVAGQSYYINSTEGAPVYFQAGNITVESGGTLYVDNVTLSFAQFVGTAGTPAVRLSHIDHFLVQAGGTVKLYNATVTTDMLELNAYAKLNVTVQGTMELRHSTFAFPGWVNVDGASATLTLNRSTVMHNPQVAQVSEPAVLQGDENYAPMLAAASGGTVNLFNSTVADTYANNLTQNGTPRPVLLGLTNNVSANGSLYPNVTLAPGANLTLTHTSTKTTDAALTQDWLYPTGITGGEVEIYYNSSLTFNTTTQVFVTYNAHVYALGTATLVHGRANARATVAFPAGLTSAINTAGLLAYLNFTGDFGVGPAKISADLTGIVNGGGSRLTVSGVFFALNPPISYSISATGAGTHLNSVDTSMDLTFNPAPASPLSLQPPLPWLANKLRLTNGANASLGNLSVPNMIPGVFEASAILADPTSEAFLFRWAQVNLTGLGGALPVYRGHITAYYAYNNVQLNNATTKWANNLQTTNHPIWKYVQYWDHLHKLPAYATSGYGGKVSMLLLSNEITAASLPDGIFMGVYHLIAVIPVAANNTHAFNGSVSPYPVGVAFGTPGYGMPDFAHPQNFPSYFAGLALQTAVVSVNGAPITNTTVRIGDTLGLLETMRDTGTAPIFSIAPSLYWNATGGALLTSANISVNLLAPGETKVVGLNWSVNESVTGDRGKFNNTFDLALVWNLDVAKFGGGLLPEPLLMTIEPSLVKITAVTTAGLTPTLNVNTLYTSTGTIAFAGVGKATLILYANPVGGGSPVSIGFAQHVPGHFTVPWDALSDRLTAGTSYVIVLRGTYNFHSGNFTLGTFSVPAKPAPAKNFLTEKFLGLPVWMWLAIAGAVAAGIAAFFLLARRGAAGKLVECGECGNLVPETATACPKCGAEFESDLVRCSRCASTIPANSQFCPECAAQLLGKPEDGARDPERDGYADFTERFRAEAKKELGENYNEGSFWDWWKRQPTYTAFSQWKLQQQGAPRAGMMAPPVQAAERPEPTPPRAPPRGGAGGAPPAASGAPGDRSMGARRPPADSAAPAGATGAASPAGGLKPCPNCRKEIPPEYLVCPFCGSVTQ